MLVSGCSIIGRRAADTLSTIVLDQDDPELITLWAGQAAALVDPGSQELVAHAEDIGRHNAVDKSLGAALLARRPVDGMGLLVTGRISAELAFKAARAGLAYVATPSVPSTLAVEIARRSGMVLVGRAVSGTPQRHGSR